MSKRLVDDELLLVVLGAPIACLNGDDYDKAIQAKEALLSSLEQPAPVQEPDNGWLEAARAWEVCASIHASFAKGKDPFFKTRHNDFVGHAENARKNAIAAPQAQPVRGPDNGRREANKVTYTFAMADAHGDNYLMDVEARTRDEAESIANRVDDDAVVARLVSFREVK